MSPRTIRRTWKEGTYMKLRSSTQLINLMSARNLTQAELGRLAGVSRQAIFNLTSGKKRTSKPLTAERIAGALRTDLADLYEIDVPTPLASLVAVAA